VTFDLRWSFEPVFPPEVFADPVAGKLLAQAGLYSDHPSNLVPAFHSVETVAGMLALDDTLLRFLLAIPVSFAPHAAARGDGTGARATSAIGQLRALAGKAEREGWDAATVAQRVDGLRVALRDFDLRHGTVNVRGDVVPDAARLMAYARPGTPPLPVPSALRALVDGEAAPLPTSGAGAQQRFTVTALTHGIPGLVGPAVRAAWPDLLEGALAVDERSGTSLSFVRDGVRTTATLHVGPLPMDALVEATTRNILSPVGLDQTAHSARVVCSAVALEGQALTADAVRTVLAIAQIFEGAGTLLDGPKVFLPSGWIQAVLAGGGPGVWPLEAMVGLQRTTGPSGQSLALVGLESLLDLGCAIHTTDPRADTVETCQRLLGLVQTWLQGAPVPSDGASVTLDDGTQAAIARGDGWVTITPQDGGRPSWVGERVRQGRLAPLNAAIHPVTGWKPEWVRARIAAGRLAPLNDAVRRAWETGTR
jgi:hypothetical protein